MAHEGSSQLIGVSRSAAIPGTIQARGFTASLASSWPLVAASALFDLKYGRALVELTRRPGTIPVFGTNGQCGWHDTALFTGPGVVLGRKGQGPLGVEWVQSDFWVIDTAYSLECLRSDVDLKYAYYLIKYVGLNHLKDGTSNPSLSRDTFRAQLFPLPPLNVQQAIASMLTTLDDKIELNRLMNETLEEIARALFKSWFVDFDPVDAKAAGKKPFGMDDATAALFPATFVGSKIDRVPLGWKIAEFQETFSVPLRNGLTRPKSVRGRGVPMINMGELFAMRRIGDVVMDRVPVSETEANDCLVEPGDLLFARQSLILEGAGQCSINLGGREVRTFESHLIRCRIDFTKGAAEYWFQYFWSSRGRQQIASIVNQVAAAGIRGSDLARLRVVVPPAQCQHAFSRTTEPLLDRLRVNNAGTGALSKLRDTLLPKLLSGELRIKDAEKIVGEAT